MSSSPSNINSLSMQVHSEDFSVDTFPCIRKMSATEMSGAVDLTRDGISNRDIS